MKKFGRATILDVLERSKKEFVDYHDALFYVQFDYRGHSVIAFMDPISDDFGWFVSSFNVVYPRCVMSYTLGVDFDSSDAYFSD